jgi:hypothetical protein
MVESKDKIESNICTNGCASKAMLVEGLANAVAKMMLLFVSQNFLTGWDICNFLEILEEKLDRKRDKSAPDKGMDKDTILTQRGTVHDKG